MYLRHGWNRASIDVDRYTHGVISKLVNDELLRNVRSEIMANISFTPKETDIYRIHQSGDLANLSGLEDSALKRVPSLLKLRNALYSEEFRNFVTAVTDCGELSGKKTDMAVNVYTQGCHLLTHDDVIGSRRISYILYLTDPDDPWKPEWGGALRLYTADEKHDEGLFVPDVGWSKVIPPAWNQLSFFEVQPGLSFHDVEEVMVKDKVRMAISGWFHLPQEGEDGYEEGLEESLAEKSSLQQLYSKSDQYDTPAPMIGTYDEDEDSDEEMQDAEEEEEPEVKGKGKERAVDPETPDADDTPTFTPDDIEFLLKYITPSYLVPDTLEQVAEELQENSYVQLANILNVKYADSLRAHLNRYDGKSTSPEPEKALVKAGWACAQPPHKHRYLYTQAELFQDKEEIGPFQELVRDLFPSKPWKKFLEVCTGTHIMTYDILGRRFRRGLDYQLASGWDPSDDVEDSDEEGDSDDSDSDESGDDDPNSEMFNLKKAIKGMLQPQFRVEVCLGVTPSSGWIDPADEDDEDDEDEENEEEKSEKKVKANGKKKEAPAEPIQEGGVGGYEMYMFGEEEESDDEEEDIPQASSSKAPAPKEKKKKKALDPAVYQAGDEDDGIAFSMPAKWNTMSIVLRDKGLLRFVKYVSAQAKGDRWDVVGAYGALPREEEDGDDEEEDEK